VSFISKAKERIVEFPISGRFLRKFSLRRLKMSVTEGYPMVNRNKFVRTKMRLKLGTKIDLSERFVRFVRFVRFAGLLDLSDI